MAEASGTDLEGYKAQLASTEMFYDPADAVAFTESAELPTTMVSVAEFLFVSGGRLLVVESGGGEDEPGGLVQRVVGAVTVVQVRRVEPISDAPDRIGDPGRDVGSGQGRLAGDVQIDPGKADVIIHRAINAQLAAD